MSAWIASDLHIASVAKYYAEQRDVDTQLIADILKAENIVSVNHRYSEDTPIEACDISKALPLNPVDVLSLASSLDYQSCETPTYNASRASEILLLVRFIATDEATSLGLPMKDSQGNSFGPWRI